MGLVTSFLTLSDKHIDQISADPALLSAMLDTDLNNILTNEGHNEPIRKIKQDLFAFRAGEGLELYLDKFFPNIEVVEIVSSGNVSCKALRAFMELEGGESVDNPDDLLVWANKSPRIQALAEELSRVRMDAFENLFWEKRRKGRTFLFMTRKPKYDEQGELDYIATYFKQMRDFIINASANNLGMATITNP